MRMAAAHGCVVAADRQAVSKAARCRRRKPQRALVAGEPVFIHRRKDGAQGWCGLGVCVLSGEPKPGRNETVWVLVRNCLRKCNRTQARPATNEEAEGIEAFASLSPELTEFVREGRTRHFADITAEGDPHDDEETFVEGDVTDVRPQRPDSQPEPESNAATIHKHKIRDPRSSRPRSPPHSIRTWRSGPATVGSDFEKRPPILRDTHRMHPRTEIRRRSRVKMCPDEQRPKNATWTK